VPVEVDVHDLSVTNGRELATRREAVNLRQTRIEVLKAEGLAATEIEDQAGFLVLCAIRGPKSRSFHRRRAVFFQPDLRTKDCVGAAGPTGSSAEGLACARSCRRPPLFAEAAKGIRSGVP
jgi:hypothetical protein